MRRTWSPAAEDKLRALYGTTPLPRLAFLLKRTPSAIRSRAKRLGLTTGFHQPWTPGHEAELRRRYPNEVTEAIAQDLGRSPSSVYQRAYDLGLKKSSQFLASGKAGRIQRGRTDPRMTAHQFKKGQPSWSKGIKGRVGVQDGCRATQFRKGKRQGVAVKLYQPIGTLRISKDGYLERKVNDDLPLQARWRAVHRIVWEAANGPIPAGHIVRFRAGMKTTDIDLVTLDSLELVTRADNMRLNSYHNYPKPIAHAVQLRGALTRQINRIKKRA